LTPSSFPPIPDWLNDDSLTKLTTTWLDYVELRPEIIGGSSLAKDDALFPVRPPSHLAWHGIIAAVEHLALLIDCLEAGTPQPLAASTLARSAILGSAHALWLLDGSDRADRQRRGLRLAHEQFQLELLRLRDLRRLDGEDGTDQSSPYDTAGVLVDFQIEGINGAIGVSAKLGMSPEEVAARPDDTAVIDTVARRYTDVVPGALQLAKAYRMLWRQYADASHGLRWSELYRANIMQQDRRGGQGYLTNDLSDLGMAASAVVIFTRRAINRFELRRQRHT
jgi:hypothetical protein